MQNRGYFFTRCSGEHEAGRGGRETREWGSHGKIVPFPVVGVSRSESALCSPEKREKNNGCRLQMHQVKLVKVISKL